MLSERAAIELAKSGGVLVIAKDSLRESSSEYAQGGIAVALRDDDEVALHEQDTLYAGDGLCDQAAVHTLVEEGQRGGSVWVLVSGSLQILKDDVPVNTITEPGAASVITPS